MNQVAHQIRSGLEETAALDQQTEELLMDFEAYVNVNQFISMIPHLVSRTLDSMRALMAREAKRSRAQRVAAVFRTRREITKSREQLVTAWNVLHAQLLSRILSAHTSCVGLMEEIQAMMARVDGLNHDQVSYPAYKGDLELTQTRLLTGFTLSRTKCRATETHKPGVRVAQMGYMIALSAHTTLH